jgi:hypothetical protein
MRYLVLLYGDESKNAEPGTPEFENEMAGYMAFDELAGEAIVGGEALHDNSTCRTIRHDGADVRVTNGPFAETVEGLGGFYVLEAPSLDDVIELVRHVPAVNHGDAEIRPMVQWFDGTAETGTETGTTDTAEAVEKTPRYLATLHGPATEADQPGTAAWDKGAAEHQRFVESAGGAVLAGGAVQPAATATTIRVRDGELLVTDGPFSETTEIVGGFYILRGTEDEATKVATHIPVNENGAVQLRLIMELDG